MRNVEWAEPIKLSSVQNISDLNIVFDWNFDFARTQMVTREK